MSFLRELIVGNGINLDLIERQIARVIFEKLKFETVDWHHPVHILRNKKDYSKMEFALAGALTERACKDMINRLVISVFGKLEGSVPWNESNRKKEKHLRRKD